MANTIAGRIKTKSVFEAVGKPGSEPSADKGTFFQAVPHTLKATIEGSEALGMSAFTVPSHLADEVAASNGKRGQISYDAETNEMLSFTPLENDFD